MELPILVVFLSSFILNVGSHPKNSDVIPKDYYKRQILQPIPGYIPVYIKADGVPVVRTQAKKQSTNVTPEKVPIPKEKNLSEQSETENSSKNQDKKLDEMSSENTMTETKNQDKKLEEPKSEIAVTEMKTQHENLSEKTEATIKESKNEKEAENSQVKVADLKS